VLSRCLVLGVRTTRILRARRGTDLDHCGRYATDYCPSPAAILAPARAAALAAAGLRHLTRRDGGSL